MARRKPTVAVTNEEAVKTLLADLRLKGRMEDPLWEALGTLASTLAQHLDHGAGMATAAVAKELRATLAQLTSKEIDGDEDETIFGNDIQPAAGTPKVRHAKKPGPANHRTPRR